MKTLCSFSSPMVNLPVVTVFASAKSRRFLIAAFSSTETVNLTLDFVYSWPGFVCCQHLFLSLSRFESTGFCLRATYIYDGVVGQGREPLVQRLVHLLRRALKEASTAYRSLSVRKILIRG